MPTSWPSRTAARRSLDLGRKNGYYTGENGAKVVQQMDIVGPDGVLVTKGLETILTERGLWNKKLSADEARELLNSQEDFQSQMEWLESVVREAGGQPGRYEIDFYPKFHCEFNFIERLWAAAKFELREQCEFNYDALKRNFPVALYGISLASIQCYSRGAR